MIVDLTEIEGSRSHQFDIAPGDLDVDSSAIRLVENARVDCEIAKGAARIQITGRIEVTAEIDCTRCLEPVRQRLPIDFDVSFVTPEDFARDGDHEVAADGLDTDVLEGDSIDLKELVREQIMLAIPEQVFCTADCKGICPQCGQNRNLIDCKCSSNEVDPRFAGLRDLLAAKEGGEQE